MKIIRFVLEDKDIEIMDNDAEGTDLIKYTKEISGIFESKNVSILETSNSCFIVRPSKVLGILIEEKKDESIDVITDFK